MCANLNDEVESLTIYQIVNKIASQSTLLWINELDDAWFQLKFFGVEFFGVEVPSSMIEQSDRDDPDREDCFYILMFRYIAALSPPISVAYVVSLVEDHAMDLFWEFCCGEPRSVAQLNSLFRKLSQ